MVVCPALPSTRLCKSAWQPHTSTRRRADEVQGPIESGLSERVQCKMPPLGSASKSKNKHVKDARHSRSRNTTPNSVLSASASASATTTTAAPAPSTTPFLQLDTSKLLVASQPNYADILDRLETKPANLDPKQLQDTIEQLKQLSDSAEKRIDSCEKAIRLIHDQLKDLDSEHKERERQADHAKRLKAKKDDSSSQKNPKAKKRKDRDRDRERDREPADVEIKREGMFVQTCALSRLRPVPSASLLRKC